MHVAIATNGLEPGFSKTGPETSASLDRLNTDTMRIRADTEVRCTSPGLPMLGIRRGYPDSSGPRSSFVSCLELPKSVSSVRKLKLKHPNGILSSVFHVEGGT